MSVGDKRRLTHGQYPNERRPSFTRRRPIDQAPVAQVDDNVGVRTEQGELPRGKA